MKIRVKLAEKVSENIFDAEEKEKLLEVEALLNHFEKRADSMPEDYMDSIEVWDDFSEFAIAERYRNELLEQADSLEQDYENTQKKNHRTPHWRSYAVYMLLIFTMASCVTFSKYLSEVSGSGMGTVAAFDVGVYMGNYVFGQNTDYFELNFEEAKADQPYTLTLENNSDVTVRFNFTFTSSAGKHTFSLSGSGVSGDSLVLKAGKSGDVVLHFYGAEETVDETARLLIRAEQVD